MIKRLLNGAATSITGAAVIVGALSLASRLLGMVRDRILAGQFGAGETLDIYYAAFRVPDLIYNLVVFGAISAGFIPLFTKYVREQGEAAGWRLANQVLNAVLILVVAVCAGLFVWTPQVMRLMAPGFSPAAIATLTDVARIMFLSPIILGVSSIFGSILQSHKRFLLFSLSSIMYNVGIIIGALAFAPSMGVYGLAWGVVLGALLHLGIQVPGAVALGYRYQPLLDLRDTGLRAMAKLMVPRTLALGLGQLNLFFITIVASTLPSGSLAVFNFANNLQTFPVGLFGISFAIAAFPTLAELALGGDKSVFSKRISDTAREILFFTVPTAILLIVLRAQVVRVILGTGAFSWEDTRRTVDALALFALSLFAQALIPLLIRGFYALHDTFTPLVTELFTTILNVALAYALSRPFTFMGAYFDLGVSGLALAFTIDSIVNVALLWVLLRLRTGSLNERQVIWSVLKIAGAGLAMGIVAQVVKQGMSAYVDIDTFMGIFLQGAAAGVTGIAVYAAACLAMRSQEMYTVVHSLRRRLFGSKELYPQPIDENVTE